MQMILPLHLLNFSRRVTLAIKNRWAVVKRNTLVVPSLASTTPGRYPAIKYGKPIKTFKARADARVYKNNDPQLSIVDRVTNYVVR